MAKTVEQMVCDSYDRARYEDFIIEQIDEDVYTVYNCKHRSEYIVESMGDYVMKCDCPHHKYRGVICKHQVAVAMEYGLYIDHGVI